MKISQQEIIKPFKQHQKQTKLNNESYTALNSLTVKRKISFNKSRNYRWVCLTQ